MIILQRFMLRTDLQQNPNLLFVFGDNYEGWGRGGQARECRGEPNAVGIPTKVSPQVFLTDTHLPHWEVKVRPIFTRLMDPELIIVWPSEGIGTGLAQLHLKAPLINERLDTLTKELFEVHGR